MQKRAQRHALFGSWVRAGRPTPPARPFVVRFTRIAPRSLDEGDNLAAAFKTFRDELAYALALKNDGPSAGVVWEYAQERGEPKQYRVRVEIMCNYPVDQENEGEDGDGDGDGDGS
jgi:hypothetical protein